jgi:16S rRNA (guanine1207-N2)-methyltransferase
MSDYYTFQKFAVDVCDLSLAVVGKPGVWSWNGLDPGTAALLEVVEVRPDDIALDLGCGTGVIGAAAGLQAPQGRVRLVDCNVTAIACSERTLAANDLSSVQVQLADGVAGLAPSSFDLVLSHLPRGRVVQEEFIQGAARVLQPGGRFCFVAHKRVGVKGAIAYTRDLFGRCGVVRQKKGYHVALAVKPDGLELSPLTESYVTHGVTLDGVETTLVSKPGVFAWDRLDDGTEALVGASEIGAGDRVLDLGCGTGLAGLAAARRAPQGHVVLVDADARAVESAQRTLAINGITNSEVFLSDCAAAVSERRFDIVITNPPFHQGVGVDYEVACQFVRAAAQVLRPGGHLFLVANRFLRYGDLVKEVFGGVETVYADNRYHVLAAMR